MYSRCFFCGCDYRGGGEEKQQNISRCPGITQEQWANSCVKVEAVERLLHSHSKNHWDFFKEHELLRSGWVHVTHTAHLSHRDKICFMENIDLILMLHPREIEQTICRVCPLQTKI